MAGGALTGRHWWMDALFFQHLRHLRVAGEAEIFPSEVGSPGIASRYLMAIAAAALGEGLVGDGLYQALVIRAVWVVALFACGLIHGEGRMGTLDLRGAEVVAGKANLRGCAFQKRRFGRGMGTMAEQAVSRFERRVRILLGLLLQRLVAGET